MEIPSHYELEKFRYDVDVKKRHQLYGMSGKIIFTGKWRSSRADPIIIVEMSDAIAEREALFYLEVNGHNNIIRTFGYVENVSNLTIFIQDFAEYSDLSNVLMDNLFIMTQPILIEMFSQIADAMSYVASKKIVHADLGCRNVLVFRVDPDIPRNNLVKITDFGLARWIDRPLGKEDSSVIPVRYCAPEILRNKRHSSYSEKSDTYSMGVLIWEALSNSEIPYSSVAADDTVEQMKKNDEKLPKPQVCDQQLWHLMNECWHNNLNRRPTFEKIKQNLSVIEVSDIRDVQSPVSFYETSEDSEYVLDVNVEMLDLLPGQFGKTYAAKWLSRETQPIVIIKMDEKPSENEELVYTDFDPHENIVHTFGFVGNNRGLILLLQESTLYGNLQVLLESGRLKPSTEALVTIFSKMVDAMMYLLSKGIVHGDLCCTNVLVSEINSSESTRNSVKLTNFSLAHKNDPSIVDNRRLTIQVRHCAPEILRSAGRSNYSEYSDVYAMGVLIWEACSKGKRPYDSVKANSDVRQRKLNGEKLPKPLLCNEQMWTIMENCWHNEPQVRYEFEIIKGILSNINKETTRRVHCYGCNEKIPQNEINNHQLQCVSQMPLVNNIDTDVNRHDLDDEEYSNSDKENRHERHPSKRPRIEYSNNTTEVRPKLSRMEQTSSGSSTQPTQYPLCKYCREPYPPGFVEQHELVCRRKESRSPVVVQEPEPSYTNCNRCNKQILTNKIADHQNSCPIKRSFEKSVQYPSCAYCNEQFPDSLLQEHVVLCPVKLRFSVGDNNKQAVNNQIVDRRDKPRPRPTINDPIPLRPVKNQPDNNQHALYTIDAQEKLFPPKPRSWWDTIRACSCFSSSKK